MPLRCGPYCGPWSDEGGAAVLVLDVANFVKWMFINMMVATAILSLSAYPRFLGAIRNRGLLPWRSVIAASIMSVLAMVFPFPVSNGARYDLRMIPVLLLGWVHGWQAALPVGIVLLLVRWMIGGPGLVPSIPYTLASIALIPFFTGRPRTMGRMAAMGLLHTMVSFLVGRMMYDRQPPEMEWYSPVWPLTAAISIVSLWVMNAAYEYVMERHRLERSLKRELALKEAILELIPYGVLFLDRDRRLTGCNQAARQFLRDGQVPQAFFTHPEIDRALRRRERISGCRVTCTTPEGERIVLISVMPMDGGGAILGMENVTSVVQEEREEALRERLEMLGRLAAMAAHEIKNPLTTIKGFTQLLARKPEFAPYQSSFQLVEGEVAHIQRVISDFLMLTERPPEPASPVDLDGMLQEVLTGTAMQFPDSGVRTALEGESGLTVMTNPQSLKQILKNLVVNAYEAMAGGGDLVVRRERRDGAIAITVADSGPGIPGDVLPVIFRPYMTTKATGTGLGLTISNKLAADLGGRLEVRSEEGRGSAFTLVLPQQPPVPA